MTQFAFAMTSMFGVPAMIVALLILAHRLTPAAVWKTWPVQTAATLALFGLHCRSGRDPADRQPGRLFR
jgi:hypothetical protein